jgi:hypothetical protein
MLNWALRRVAGVRTAKLLVSAPPRYRTYATAVSALEQVAQQLALLEKKALTETVDQDLSK